MIVMKFLLVLGAAPALVALVRWLRLGDDVRIENEEHAKRLLFTELHGFVAQKVIVDTAHKAALAFDARGQKALIWVTGARHSARLLGKGVGIAARNDAIIVDLREPALRPFGFAVGHVALARAWCD